MACADPNEVFVQSAMADIFGGSLKAADVQDLVCLKTAFSSDLFALGQLVPDAALDGLTLAPADDWQMRRLQAARDAFPDRFPDPETVSALVASGFIEGGKKVGVVADFGAAGRFVYFEL